MESQGSILKYIRNFMGKFEFFVCHDLFCLYFNKPTDESADPQHLQPCIPGLGGYISDSTPAAGFYSSCLQ